MKLIYNGDLSDGSVEAVGFAATFKKGVAIEVPDAAAKLILKNPDWKPASESRSAPRRG